jgi:altronate dehydratase
VAEHSLKRPTLRGSTAAVEVGSPIAPVIKGTASRRTIEAMAEIIDFDARPVLLGEESLEDFG